MSESPDNQDEDLSIDQLDDLPNYLGVASIDLAGAFKDFILTNELKSLIKDLLPQLPKKCRKNIKGELERDLSADYLLKIVKKEIEDNNEVESEIFKFYLALSCLIFTYILIGTISNYERMKDFSNLLDDQDGFPDSVKKILAGCIIVAGYFGGPFITSKLLTSITKLFYKNKSYYLNQLPLDIVDLQNQENIKNDLSNPQTLITFFKEKFSTIVSEYREGLNERIENIQNKRSAVRSKIEQVSEDVKLLLSTEFVLKTNGFIQRCNDEENKWQGVYDNLNKFVKDVEIKLERIENQKKALKLTREVNKLVKKDDNSDLQANAEMDLDNELGNNINDIFELLNNASALIEADIEIEGGDNIKEADFLEEPIAIPEEIREVLGIENDAEIEEEEEEEIEVIKEEEEVAY